jgi:hypothetical protein
MRIKAKKIKKRVRILLHPATFSRKYLLKTFFVQAILQRFVDWSYFVSFSLYWSLALFGRLHLLEFSW